MKNTLYNVLEMLEWFNYHNKNLTKTQYYKIDEAIQIINKTLKEKEVSMPDKLKEVWTVDRNSPEDGEQGTPVKVFSTREKAVAYMRKLNEKAFGCIVDCNGFVTDVEDDYLYYNIGSFDVDDEQY